MWPKNAVRNVEFFEDNVPVNLNQIKKSLSLRYRLHFRSAYKRTSVSQSVLVRWASPMRQSLCSGQILGLNKEAMSNPRYSLLKCPYLRIRIYMIRILFEIGDFQVKDSLQNLKYLSFSGSFFQSYCYLIAEPTFKILSAIPRE